MRRLLFLALLIAVGARAHDRSSSYSVWTVTADPEGYRLDFRLRLRSVDLARTYGWQALQKLQSQISVAGTKALCSWRDLVPVESKDSRWTQYQGQMKCSEYPQHMQVSLFEDSFAGHLHYARLQNGAKTFEHVFRGLDAKWDLGSDRGQTLIAWLKAGFFHVLSGLDHMAFLFSLLLLGLPWRRLLVVISSFTLAHSLSLALAALKVVQASSSGVEAMIAFSIVLVATEVFVSADPTKKNHYALSFLAGLAFIVFAAFCFSHQVNPLLLAGFALIVGAQYYGMPVWMMTFFFGLFHGLGFAAGLLDLTQANSGILKPLLGFNLGVEGAQILVVGFCGLFYWALKKVWAPAKTSTLRFAGAGAAVGAGTFWMLLRLGGL